MDIAHIILKILYISLLNIILSCDNISIILLITRSIPIHLAKKANSFGISIALFFTIFFAYGISVIMEIQWFPIQPIGGLFLLKIAVDMLRNNKAGSEKSLVNNSCGQNAGFFAAVSKIVLASLALSFDNILAISGAADGNMFVIACGLIVSLPFILFGSRYLIHLIEEKQIIHYICCAILIFTAFEMIFSYPFIAPYIPKPLSLAIPLSLSAIITFFGFISIKKAGKRILASDSDERE